jgi:hypothetical protein
MIDGMSCSVASRGKRCHSSSVMKGMNGCNIRREVSRQVYSVLAMLDCPSGVPTLKTALLFS